MLMRMFPEQKRPSIRFLKMEGHAKLAGEPSVPMVDLHSRLKQHSGRLFQFFNVASQPEYLRRKVRDACCCVLVCMSIL